MRNLVPTRTVPPCALRVLAALIFVPFLSAAEASTAPTSSREPGNVLSFTVNPQCSSGERSEDIVVCGVRARSKYRLPLPRASTPDEPASVKRVEAMKYWTCGRLLDRWWCGQR
jgi:hypothetical protein